VVSWLEKVSRRRARPWLGAHARHSAVVGGPRRCDAGTHRSTGHDVGSEFSLAACCRAAGRQAPERAAVWTTQRAANPGAVRPAAADAPQRFVFGHIHGTPVCFHLVDMKRAQAEFLSCRGRAAAVKFAFLAHLPCPDCSPEERILRGQHERHA
jgi:hypothetical protein